LRVNCQFDPEKDKNDSSMPIIPKQSNRIKNTMLAGSVGLKLQDYTRHNVTYVNLHQLDPLVDERET